MKYILTYQVSDIDTGFLDWEKNTHEFDDRADLLHFLREMFESESEGQFFFRNITIDDTSVPHKGESPIEFKRAYGSIRTGFKFVNSHGRPMQVVGFEGSKTVIVSSIMDKTPYELMSKGYGEPRSRANLAQSIVDGACRPLKEDK